VTGVNINLGSGAVGVRAAVRRARAACLRLTEELLRSLMMVVVLQPLVSLRLVKPAQTAARSCGAFLFRIPSIGTPLLRAMQRAFSMNETDGKRAAQEYLAQPFCSFVSFAQISSGRANANNWKIEELNGTPVHGLRETGRSFILATGHFRRESTLVLFTRRICPGKVATVSNRAPRFSLRPDIIRRRIQFGQWLDMHQRTRPDNTFVYVGDGKATAAALSHLQTPGNQLFISIDAFWKQGSRTALTRPFAAMRARTFSTGSTKLSRLAQCPIVVCATYLRDDGTVVVDWGPVLEPPAPDDEKADVKNAAILLDFLEDAIGRRPCQYTLYFGEERRWSAKEGKWQDESKIAS
jgi:lauroyl/myristoyl acyltransferase